MFMGNLTYSIYLTHIPIIAWLATRLHGAALVFTALLCTLIISVLLARFVEAPLERWRKTWQTKGTTHAQAAATVSWGVPWVMATTAIMGISTIYFCAKAFQWS